MATDVFAEFFNDRGTSDIEVVLKVVQNDDNLLRRKLQLPSTVSETGSADICAHALMLMAHSPVWKV